MAHGVTRLTTIALSQRSKREVQVTLTQLKAFVMVARLGSVKAAAESLEVTEPAVSGAVAALRRELGDPLFVRAAVKGGALTRQPNSCPTDRCPRACFGSPLRATAVRILAGTKEWSVF